MPHVSNNAADHHDPPLDRRQRRTRAALRDALFALLNEHDYAAITVKDIAERADIARKTFYLHYADKDALLWEGLESLFDELVAEMGALDAETLLADGKPLTYPLFVHVKAHAPVYRALLGEHGPAAFVPRLLAYIARASYAKHAPLRAMARQVSVDPHFTARFLSGAAVGVLLWWLEEDKLTAPPETVAYTFSQLAAPGVLAALGLEG